MQPHAWECPCGARNALSLAACHKCGRPQASGQVVRPVPPPLARTQTLPARRRSQWWWSVPVVVLFVAAFALTRPPRTATPARSQVFPRPPVPSPAAADLAPCGHPKFATFHEQGVRWGQCKEGEVYRIIGDAWVRDDSDYAPRAHIPGATIREAEMLIQAGPAPCGHGWLRWNGVREGAGGRCVEGHFFRRQGDGWVPVQAPPRRPPPHY
jgi:hypothetical protein